MLLITIPPVEIWDEQRQEFINFKGQCLRLEHSLVSLSKWESNWGKPFLTKKEKTYEETIDYIRCMTITQNVDSDAYRFITNENIRQVDSYINASMTATTFSAENKQGRPSREQVTAELIYYWMIALNIPFECQKWHLNRLFTLIRACEIKNRPPKKRSKKDLLKHHAAVNAARRKKR